MTHEEKIIRGKKKKRIFIIAALAIVGLFIILGGVVLILETVRTQMELRRLDELAREAEADRRTLTFPIPNWGFNIFEDEYYLSLDREIWVLEGGMRTVITDANRANYPAEIQFMAEVVQLIINGDSHAYADIFTDEYWDDPRNREVWWALLDDGEDGRERMDGFTMQRLWNIELSIVGRSEWGTDIRLSYRIHRNDGTFRDDIPFRYNTGEQGESPMIYRLVSDGEGSFRISHKFRYQFAPGQDFD